MTAAYTKAFSRERSLLLNQVWYWGEAVEPNPGSSLVQPFQPYIVFHRNGDKVDAYYDPRGIEWVKEYFFEVFNKDRVLARSYAEEYAKYVDAHREVITTQPVLDREELIRYCDDLRKAWAYLNFAWWAIEALEEKEEYKDELEFYLGIRKRTEPETPASELIILKSLSAIFPESSRFARVISYGELAANALPEVSELEKRLSEYIYTARTLYPGASKVLVEKTFDIRLENDLAEGIIEAKGTPAFKGVVRGRVRKVYTMDDVAQFQKGEILVTSSTLPPFLPALMLAGGIVADEGGLVSHAAIIARELKKPCIIGAKIATQIFKNGDIVEVDADNGVARKI